MKGFPAKYFRFTGLDENNIPIGYEYEAIGSFGFGFQAFFLGFPIHIEFVKAMEWESMSKPFEWNVTTGWMTKFWIGFDF